MSLQLLSRGHSERITGLERSKMEGKSVALYETREYENERFNAASKGFMVKIGFAYEEQTKRMHESGKLVEPSRSSTPPLAIVNSIFSFTEVPQRNSQSFEMLSLASVTAACTFSYHGAMPHQTVHYSHLVDNFDFIQSKSNYFTVVAIREWIPVIPELIQMSRNSVTIVLGRFSKCVFEFPMNS